MARYVSFQQTELTRLRTNDLVIRTSLAACQSDANNRLLELNSLRIQLTCSEEEGSQAKSAVLVLTGEKQSLQRQLVELQTALDFLRKQRSQGFDAIEQVIRHMISSSIDFTTYCHILYYILHQKIHIGNERLRVKGAR